MSNAEEILKKHICNSCYDKTLHSLVNNPFRQVESAMQEHTNQALQKLKEEVEGMKQEEAIYADMCYNEALWRVINAIDEAINE